MSEPSLSIQKKGVLNKRKSDTARLAVAKNENFSKEKEKREGSEKGATEGALSLGDKKGFLERERRKIAPRQLGFFFLSFLPCAKLLYLPPLLAERVENDLWIPVLLLFLLDYALLFFILLAARKGATFPDVFYNAFGKPLSYFIFVLFILLFWAKCYVTLGEERLFTEACLYETTSKFYYFFPALLLGWYLATRTLKTVGRTADIMAFLSAGSLLLLLFLSLLSAKPAALLPVLFRKGKAVISAAGEAAIYFGDSVAALFFLGSYRPTKKEIGKISACYLAAAAVVVLFYALFYAVFTSLAKEQPAAFLNVGKYGVALSDVGRVDFLPIYGLLTTAMIGLSLPGLFSTQIAGELFPKMKKSWTAAIFFGTLATAMLYTFEYYAAISAWIRTRGMPLILALQFLIPALAIISFFLQGKRRKE